MSVNDEILRVAGLTLGSLQQLQGDAPVLDDAHLDHVRITIRLRLDVFKRCGGVGGQAHGHADACRCP